MSPLASSDHLALAQLSRRSSLPVMSSVAVQTAFLIALWSQRYRTRTSLKHLPDYVLRDIGLTPTQAKSESCKWFWRP